VPGIVILSLLKSMEAAGPPHAIAVSKCPRHAHLARTELAGAYSFHLSSATKKAWKFSDARYRLVFDAATALVCRE